jgi:regulator of nucleoside diphosphate kinase
MLFTRSVLLGHRDHDRIQALLQNTRSDESRLLYDELDSATVVQDHLLPGDVVRMNSTVTFIDLDTSQETTLELVYPHEVESTPNAISILAPMGAALIGLRVGESIEWPLPSGRRRRIKVVAVGASG